MPTYEYRCRACGHEFEKFQSIVADPIKTCPVCGKESVSRLVGGGAGLLFKGSGFYITDYKNSKPKTEKPKTEKPKAENSKNEKSDTKTKK
ncbi:zinc ribbon domain-containing protein [candidate division KSB1 bacterium]|nr:zinc ribbon domain-containing protein [candidate division KSB1 bacterium]